MAALQPVLRVAAAWHVRTCRAACKSARLCGRIGTPRGALLSSPQPPCAAPTLLGALQQLLLPHLCARQGCHFPEAVAARGFVQHVASAPAQHVALWLPVRARPEAPVDAASCVCVCTIACCFG
jgi:hypothetical protein